ncbi:MAG: hypothetical protein HY220_00015 [Candidatus Sungbacteria bacterium]|uniref:Pilus assembly protein PilO n=1 Tax=Candidatus Sungiibacteriota bacterium TaxID=2750080 RepID=A0A9D6QTN8_9BACT|nr:hypothetical protein [Candidatus Sungbacteria bacterium]
MSKTQFSIILFLIAFAIFYFFTFGQWNDLQVFRADNIAASKAIDELKQLEARRRQLTDAYNSLPQADLAKVGAIIPTGTDQESLIVDLETLSRRDGMTLKKIDFAIPTQSQSAAPAPSGEAPPSIPNGLNVLPITLEISGRYGDLRRFLQDLELNERLIDVTQNTFSASVGNAASDIYAYTIQAKAYFQ